MSISFPNKFIEKWTVLCSQQKELTEVGIQFVYITSKEECSGGIEMERLTEMSGNSNDFHIFVRMLCSLRFSNISCSLR